MLKLEQIILPIKYTSEHVFSEIAKKLNIAKKDILDYKILKQSIDARKKPNIKYIVNLAVSLNENLEKKYQHLSYVDTFEALNYEKKNTNKQIVIVGFGPSGMFCALALAKMGLKPLVIEQGKMVDDREKDVLDFWNYRKLNKYSNVQFGEGGAGTFSDGKLNTNLNNNYCKIVTNELYLHGAPKEITYINKPHIGSDKLKSVVKNIREEIISLGGKFLFSTKLCDINIKNEELISISVENVESGEKGEVSCDYLCLCVGHSARDTFKMLYSKGLNIRQKPFAMGVRIEQKQKDINLSQYGKQYIDGLPNADYKLVEHLPNGRSVFTFCMCPGGEVVASSSNEGEIVTNGMSEFARDKENANSALLVNITCEDYESEHALAGIKFQEKYERMAFDLGGGNFNAPAQSVGNFLGYKDCKTNINYTYRPNLTFTEIEKCLPKVVSESLKLALPLLNNKLNNFAKNENLLIAIESRSSCPLTIVRNEDYESNIKGIYPVGEGAGYAGGIISSAQDGIKTAEAIYKTMI